MLEGKTADCLAIANTAILMRLVDELIACGVISGPAAKTVLKDAVDSLQNCPNGDHSNFVDAVAIIRQELMPKLASSPRAA
jgi:hypothetical protein